MTHNPNDIGAARALLATLLLAVWLGSCVPGKNDYSGFQPLPEARWAYGDTLTFIPQTVDSLSDGTLTLSLRHGNEYVYSNLWLEVTYVDARQGKRVDTLDIVLADKFGKWRGHGIGTSFQTTDTINPRLRLATGSPVKVRHVMRSDTIEGIYEVGIEYNENAK